jgi:integrase
VDTAVGQYKEAFLLNDTPADGPQNPTYTDLLAYYDEVITPAKPGSVANMRSALKMFLGKTGLNYSNAIGPEFGEDFPVALGAFKECLKTAGMKSTSLENKLTLIRAWHEIYVQYIEVLQAPTCKTLGEALRFYFEKAKEKDSSLSKRKVCRMAGFQNYDFISYAIHHDSMSTFKENHSSLSELEKILGTPPLALMRFVLVESTLSERGSATQQTTFGKKVAKRGKDKYRLKFHKIPPQLREEMRSFIKFKTSVIPDPLERNESWILRNNEEFSRSSKMLELITIDGKMYAESSAKFVHMMMAFFGSLNSLGYDPERFSLAYLADVDLLKESLQFWRDRTGEITQTPLLVFVLAASMLFKRYGFLRQQPFYGQRLLTPVHGDRWDEECENRRKIIIDIEKKIRKDEVNGLTQGRDPFEGIHEILQRQHPISAITELIKNMKDHLVKRGPFMTENEKIALRRDIIMLSILKNQPLRVRMIRNMTYLEDNSGHLYSKPNGAWAIRFNSYEFKNYAGAAKNKPYDVELPQKLWPEVEDYLNHVRPLFQDSSPLFFVSLPYKTRPEGRRTEALSRAIRIRSRQFLPGCPGFGPHSFRHLVATDLIRNNPMGGFEIAAGVLHDEYETVKEHYAWVRACDYHGHYQEYLKKIEEEGKA